MPRTRRPHEEHLESIEPVGVVILNDLSYLLQDVAEVVLDLGKLLRNRREEVLAFMELGKEGQAALPKAFPPEVVGFLMGSAFEVFGKAMEIKAGIGGAGGPGEHKTLDLSNAKPEMLEGLGGLLKEKAEGLENLIRGIEDKILAEHPPR